MRRAGWGPVERDAQRRRWRAPAESSDLTPARFRTTGPATIRRGPFVFPEPQRSMAMRTSTAPNLRYLAAGDHPVSRWPRRPRELPTLARTLPAGRGVGNLSARHHGGEPDPGGGRDAGYHRLHEQSGRGPGAHLRGHRG